MTFATLPLARTPETFETQVYVRGSSSASQEPLAESSRGTPTSKVAPVAGAAILAVGGLFIVRFLAPFVVSPVAGVFADRYNRKYLLIAADLGRAVVVMGFLLVREPEQVWLLYTLSALQMGLSGFFFPALVLRYEGSLLTIFAADAVGGFLGGLIGPWLPLAMGFRAFFCVLPVIWTLTHVAVGSAVKPDLPQDDLAIVPVGDG